MFVVFVCFQVRLNAGRFLKMKQSAKGREYREKFEEGNSTNDIVFIVTTFIIVFIVINRRTHDESHQRGQCQILYLRLSAAL